MCSTHVRNPISDIIDGYHGMRRLALMAASESGAHHIGRHYFSNIIMAVIIIIIDGGSLLLPAELSMFGSGFGMHCKFLVQ